MLEHWTRVTGFFVVSLVVSEPVVFWNVNGVTPLSHSWDKARGSGVVLTTHIRSNVNGREVIVRYERGGNVFTNLLCSFNHLIYINQLQLYLEVH